MRKYVRASTALFWGAAAASQDLRGVVIRTPEEVTRSMEASDALVNYRFKERTKDKILRSAQGYFEGAPGSRWEKYQEVLHAQGDAVAAANTASMAVEAAASDAAIGGDSGAQDPRSKAIAEVPDPIDLKTQAQDVAAKMKRGRTKDCTKGKKKEGNGQGSLAQWTASGEVAKEYFPNPSETAPAAEAALLSQKLEKAKATSLIQKKPIVVKYKIKNKTGRPPPPPIPRAWPPPEGFLPPELRKKLMPNLVAPKPATKKKDKKPAPILGVVYHDHLVTDERGLEEIVKEHPLSGGHRNLIKEAH